MGTLEKQGCEGTRLPPPRASGVSLLQSPHAETLEPAAAATGALEKQGCEGARLPPPYASRVSLLQAPPAETLEPAAAATGALEKQGCEGARLLPPRASRVSLLQSPPAETLEPAAAATGALEKQDCEGARLPPPRASHWEAAPLREERLGGSTGWRAPLCREPGGHGRRRPWSSLNGGVPAAGDDRTRPSGPVARGARSLARVAGRLSGTAPPVVHGKRGRRRADAVGRHRQSAGGQVTTGPVNCFSADKTLR